MTSIPRKIWTGVQRAWGHDASKDPTKSTWILALIVSSIGFASYLAIARGYRDEPIVGLAFYLCGIGLLAAVVFTTPKTAKWRTVFLGAGLMAWGVLYFAEVLTSFWSNPNATSFAVGGLIPGNDAAGWLESSWALIQHKRLDGMGLRRPLDSSLRSMFLLFGQNLQNGITITAFVSALACVLAVVQVQKTFGWLIAAIFFLSTAVMIKSHVPLVMSELHGFAFGCLAFSCLWISSTNKNLILYWGLGLAFMSIGLEVRPGPMFISLGILVYGLSASQYSSYSRVTFVIVGLLAAGLGFFWSNLLTFYWSDSIRLSHPQFAYTFYGMVRGGLGWESALHELSGLGESEIFREGMAILVENPMMFLSFFGNELVNFFRLFIRYELGISRILFAIGMVWLVWHWNNRLGRLLLLTSLGIWLSSPFLMLDGGERVFAATYPFIAMVPILGIILVIRLMKSDYPIDSLDIQSIDARAENQRVSSLVILGLISVIAIPLVLPIIMIEVSGTERRAISETFGMCPESKESLLINGRNSVLLRVWPDQKGRGDAVPDLTQSTLLRTLPNDGGDGQDGGIYNWIRGQVAPYTIVAVSDPGAKIGIVYVVLQGTLLSDTEKGTTLCISNDPSTPTTKSYLGVITS